MKTKTLNTIQTVSKIAGILSTVGYVCCLVGAILCAAGILSLRFIPEGFKIGGMTIQGLMEASEKLTTEDLYVMMTTFLIVLAGDAVVCKIAQRYFKNEFKAGTPFTCEGAKELLCLGVCAMVIPVAASMIAQLVCHILFPGNADAFDLSYDISSSVLIGALLLVMSLLCRHGAEVSQPEAAAEPALPEETADEEA